MSRFLISLFVVAAVCRVCVAVTGADAASLITDDPRSAGWEENDTYTVELKAYDMEARAAVNTSIEVEKNATFDDIESFVKRLGWSLSVVAENSIKSLAKIAYLEGKSERLRYSVTALKESTIKAFESLDSLTLEDVDTHISKRLSRASTTSGTRYVGNGVFNVAAAQVDGITIVSNGNDRIQIGGFNAATTKDYSIPHYEDDLEKLIWTRIGWFADGDSIQDKTEIGGNEYCSGIKIAGWERPTVAPHACAETIAQTLTNGNPAVSHYVLTKKIGGADDGKLHYMGIGRLDLSATGGGGVIQFVGTDGNGAYVGSGPVTNKVTFASASDSAVDVKVSGEGGDVTVTIGVYWKP